ncbi:MAG: hypothetical protein EKK36_02365 [Bradyrhizobiaceae bacterium]|nr:MAG: hypothetical protein EKK36_02365 [Bradyrhizobiaceae bacterium]
MSRLTLRSRAAALIYRFGKSASPTPAAMKPAGPTAAQPTPAAPSPAPPRGPTDTSPPVRAAQNEPDGCPQGAAPSRSHRMACLPSTTAKSEAP